MNHEVFLLVVVGESGAGKSTFIEAMELEPYHCTLSRPMLEELQRKGIEITHDNIHALSREWYRKDRYWQVAYVLEQLNGKNFLILDGLRYAFELKRLRYLFFNVVVVKIVSTSEARYIRLCERRKVRLNHGLEEFKRLERDELEDMDVSTLMNKADIAIENTGSLEELKEKAKRTGNLFRLIVKEK